jgi:hypothetical protein
MRIIFFLLAFLAGYYWLSEHGYTEQIAQVFESFNPADFIEFIKSLFTKIYDTVKDLIEQLSK